MSEIDTFTIDPPYTFVTEYLDAATAESKAAVPDAERVNTHTVKITGDTLDEIAEKR
jgi:D-aminopeptidase